MPYKEREQTRKEKVDKSAKTKRDKCTKDLNGVHKMRSRWGHENTHLFEKCDKEECGAYLQYKKNQGKGEKADGAMPKELQDRRARCVEYMSRPSPAASPYQSDNEDIKDTTMQSASALLALASHELSVREDGINSLAADLEVFDGNGHHGDEDGERNVYGDGHSV